MFPTRASSAAPRGASAVLPPAARVRERGLRLALAGGGTGGHIVPGLHLVEHARSSPGGGALGDLLWFTSGRSVEARVFGAFAGDARCERVALPLEPEGGGAPSRRELALRTPGATLRARRALRAHRSDVLLGLGGFTSLPAVIAARSLGIPVALLEVNAAAGSATRALAPFASAVFHAWRASVPPSTAGRRRAARHAHVGPPLAPGYRAPAGEDALRARARLGFDPDEPLCVVLGGSQGAGAINRFVAAHAPAIVASGVQVLHQTGPGRAAEGCAPFTGYRAEEYLDDVGLALRAATVVLTRGGASTLAEVAALRRPAFVVPYPHHADRHQERNAAELGDGVRVVPEHELGFTLRAELVELAVERGRERRERMAAALASAMPDDGAARLWAGLVELAVRKSR